MAFHLRRRKGLRTDAPAYGLRLKILDLCLSICCGLRWSLPSDFMQFTHFERVLEKLDWNSSPGYPLVYQYSTNRILFGVKDGIINELRKIMVWEMVCQRIQSRDSDPIRLFIKPEPHKKKKLENKAYRLISSVSVVDQIIDHMLNDPMNDLATSNWWNNPVKIGWSQLLGGWKVMPRHYLAMDKSSWDWTVMLWLLEMVFELRALLCNTKGPQFELWRELASWRFEQLFVKFKFVTSGGFILESLIQGVMKSGMVSTLIDNSLMQLIIHIRVSLELGQLPVSIMAMGDDVVMQFISYLKEYLDLMNQFCIVKSVSYKTEFAGHRFEECGFVEPLYRGKHAFNLLHVSEKLKQQIGASYALLYHRSKHREWIRKLLESIGCQLPALYELDEIYDGEL